MCNVFSATCFSCLYCPYLYKRSTFLFVNSTCFSCLSYPYLYKRSTFLLVNSTCFSCLCYPYLYKRSTFLPLNSSGRSHVGLLFTYKSTKGRKRRARHVIVSQCFTCPVHCFSLLYLLCYLIFNADSTAKVTSAERRIIK